MLRATAGIRIRRCRHKRTVSRGANMIHLVLSSERDKDGGDQARVYASLSSMIKRTGWP